MFVLQTYSSFLPVWMTRLPQRILRIMIWRTIIPSVCSRDPILSFSFLIDMYTFELGTIVLWGMTDRFIKRQKIFSINYHSQDTLGKRDDQNWYKVKHISLNIFSNVHWCSPIEFKCKNNHLCTVISEGSGTVGWIPSHRKAVQEIQMGQKILTEERILKR